MLHATPQKLGFQIRKHRAPKLDLRTQTHRREAFLIDRLRACGVRFVSRGLGCANAV
jgi:hypothetical protein